jgi:hypothetical protein
MGFSYTASQKFLFGPQFDEKRMMDAVVENNEPDLKRVKRHAECGAHPVVRFHPDSDSTALGCSWCEYRTCPRCRRKHQIEVSAALAAWIGHPGRNEWRFITLTLGHGEAELTHKLDHLQESFRRLRQQKIWKESQTYGKGIIEIAFNAKTRTWHPHLHIVSRGNFIAQRELSKAWEKASEGSRIVDVRILKSERACAKYVSKYLGKPPDLEGVDDKFRWLQEYYMGMRNRKMIISFGDAPPLPHIGPTPEMLEKEANSIVLGPLSGFILRAAAGDDVAKAVLLSLQDGKPLSADVVAKLRLCEDRATPPGKVPVPTSRKV